MDHFIYLYILFSKLVAVATRIESGPSVVNRSITYMVNGSKLEPGLA